MACGDLIALGNRKIGDLPRDRGAERVLHLHRFHHDKALTGLDLVALTDQNLRDAAGHGGLDRARATCPGIARQGIGARDLPATGAEDAHVSLARMDVGIAGKVEGFRDVFSLDMGPTATR